MELIPGLPDELGRECLIRVPFESFPSVFSVCKAWNLEIQTPDFHRLRKLSGHTRPVFILGQAQSGSFGSTNPEKYNGTPSYWLTVFDPESGSWTRLPPSPGLPVGLPLFCGVVGVGSKIIVIGGWEPGRWQVSNAVHVFDFLTGQWGHGADMPGPGRSLFGVASNPVHQTVVVAGGHDDEKTALSSALMYDVAKDTWLSLADMEKERDECHVVFHGGRFHAISGYPTEMQGHFQNNAESLDPDTWQRGPVDEEFLEGLTSKKCWAVGNTEGDMYARMGDDMAVWREGGRRWRAVVEVPDQVRISQRVMTWRNRMMVIGCQVYGGPQKAYMLDLKRCEWSDVDIPDEYSGHIQSGCGMEL